MRPDELQVDKYPFFSPKRSLVKKWRGEAETMRGAVRRGVNLHVEM